MNLNNNNKLYSQLEPTGSSALYKVYKVYKLYKMYKVYKVYKINTQLTINIEQNFNLQSFGLQ